MSEEVFRQRKPISKAEIQESIPSPAEMQAAMQQAAIPQQANAPQFPPAMPHPEQMPPQGNLSFKNLKNAPPEFLQQLGQVPAPTAHTPANTHMGVPVNQEYQNIIDIIDNCQVYEEQTLPSLGKFYNGEDGPVDGVLHVRPMTGEEEQILATSRFVKKGLAINMIFDRCIKENYKSEKFLAVDRTFLLILLRGISYSPAYDVEITCPFTDKKFSATIDLNLDIDLCPEDFGPASLVGKLPKTQLDFRYRLALGSDEQKIQEHRDMKAKFDSANQADDTLLYRTTLLIEEIQGISDKNSLQQILKKLPSGDVAYLRNLTSEPPFGVNTKITITSPYTNEDFEIDLPLEASFFFPRQKKVPTQA